MSDFRQYLGRTVMIQMDGDYTLGGILDREAKTSLILTDASLHGDAPAPMDGEVLVPTGRILWMQAV